MRNSSYKNIEGILDIGANGLCHRCGGCVGICPVNTLALDADGFPMQIGECISCSLCTDICSGATVNFSSLGSWLYGPGYTRSNPLGEIRQVYIGHSTDEVIRWAGASGGVVTRLLTHLLESGAVQGAIVAGPHPDDPALGQGHTAYTAQELLASAQSRYTTTPMLCALEAIRDDKENNYAVVALPCQVHTLRKLQMHSDAWRKRIGYIIGLYCHYRLPHEATRELAALQAPVGCGLASIKYRKKDPEAWPKNTAEMTFTDGSKWCSPYDHAQTVSLLAHCYPRDRCLLCVDALAEFGDLSIGDPWIRDVNGEWKYDDPGGRSVVIVRTATGEKLFNEAVQSGALQAESIPHKEVTAGQHSMISEKFTSTPVRMAWLKHFGRRLPDYGLPPLQANTKARFKAGSFLLLHLITTLKPVRQVLLRLGFSKAGQWGMGWRRRFNRRRAVKRLYTETNQRFN